MLRLVSLGLIVGACASALIVVGQGALGNDAVQPGDGTLYALFKAFPKDWAYGAPLLALALVTAGFVFLRILGHLISIGFMVLIFGAIGVALLRPEWLSILQAGTG